MRGHHAHRRTGGETSRPTLPDFPRGDWDLRRRPLHLISNAANTPFPRAHLSPEARSTLVRAGTGGGRCRCLDVTMQVVHDQSSRANYSRLEEDTTDVGSASRCAATRGRPGLGQFGAIGYRVQRRHHAVRAGIRLAAMGSVFAQNEARWRDGVRLVLGARMGAASSAVGPQPTATGRARDNTAVGILSGAARTPAAWSATHISTCRLGLPRHFDPWREQFPRRACHHVGAWLATPAFAQGVALDATLFLSRYRRFSRAMTVLQPFTAEPGDHQRDGRVGARHPVFGLAVTRHWHLNGQFRPAHLRVTPVPGSLTNSAPKDRRRARSWRSSRHTCRTDGPSTRARATWARCAIVQRIPAAGAARGALRASAGAISAAGRARRASPAGILEFVIRERQHHQRQHSLMLRASFTD
jgi:hypothetical protein